MRTPPATEVAPQNQSAIEVSADLVVIGGGLSGVCAAVAAARNGATVILAQNRPVLGGNASSEIGIGIVGATCAGGRWDARETGILEEVQLAARRLDPTGGPASLDMALWEVVEREKNCTLLLNTHITDVKTDGRRIVAVSGAQQGTEKLFRLSGTIFADNTGDGTIADRAGCRSMIGREAKVDFDEPDALEEADDKVMGSSIYWVARDLGYPVPFTKPDWAFTYTDEDLALRPHDGGDRFKYGFWWVETGGDTDDTIADNESIRDELWKIAYGLWDHVKNKGDHGAENFVLERVGLLPGKRESRRIIGDYILREQDVLERRQFEDAIAYGGWTMDLHIPGGMRHLDQRPNYHITNGLYTIPWRSLIAADCDNLLIGGRLISATHLATSTARVMATCAVIGQALGTGAALAATRACSNREVGAKHIRTLQQTLLADDCFLCALKSADAKDLSHTARVTASSQMDCAPAERVQDGYQRNRPDLRPDWIKDKKTNPPNPDEILEQGSAWISKSLDADAEPTLRMEWDKPVNIAEIRPIFDSNLSLDITQSSRGRGGKDGFPVALVRGYSLSVWNGDERVWTDSVSCNMRRNPLHVLPEGICGDKVELTITSTHGSKHARVFALRVHTP